MTTPSSHLMDLLKLIYPGDARSIDQFLCSPQANYGYSIPLEMVEEGREGELVDGCRYILGIGPKPEHKTS